MNTRRDLQVGMGRVLGRKCAGVNQIGIVACRLAWGLSVSSVMKQPSLLIRWFAPILFALTLSGFAAAENPATEENKAKISIKKSMNGLAKQPGLL